MKIFITSEIMFRLAFRALRKSYWYFYRVYSNIIAGVLMKGNGVIRGSGNRFLGIPFISVSQNGYCTIGKQFVCNSGDANPIGRNTKTYIVVGDGASLTIGDRVGISNTAISCYERIEIGNDVKIGGGVAIYDTDFHSLDHRVRSDRKLDLINKQTSPIKIENDAFIGAHSTILKGVTIGERAIIGAGSVVTKNVPPNEVWAGNPARFIRMVDSLR